MGKTHKNIKYNRTVILFKYKDINGSQILSKSVKRRNQKIKIICKTRKSLYDNKLKETYPIFKEQLKERIVPRCLRAKCGKKNNHIRLPQQQKYTPGKTEHDPNHVIQRKRSISLSSISSNELSDISNISFGYESINSSSLSSYKDDEVETLMTSTRKRMKMSNDEWSLFLKHPSTSVTSESDNLNSSFNSLDTLVLEADNSKEYLDIIDLKKEAYTPMRSEELIYKPLIFKGNKDKTNFKRNEFSYENNGESDNEIL